MKTTVSESAFIDAFKGGQYENNFSYAGLCALYEYLEEYEESTGEQIEFDTVSIACDFAEYEFDYLKDLYSNLIADATGDEELDDEEILELFRDHTTVILIDGTTDIIIQQF